jgi:hypothetical protein
MTVPARVSSYLPDHTRSTLSPAQDKVTYRASNGMTISGWQIGKCVDWIVVPAYSWTDCRKPGKTSVGIVGVPFEIRAVNLPNSSRKRCRLRHFTWSREFSEQLIACFPLTTVSVSIAIRLKARRPRNRGSIFQIFIFSTASKPALWPTKPRIQWTGY